MVISEQLCCPINSKCHGIDILLCLEQRYNYGRGLPSLPNTETVIPCELWCQLWHDICCCFQGSSESNRSRRASHRSSSSLFLPTTTKLPYRWMVSVLFVSFLWAATCHVAQLGHIAGILLRVLCLTCSHICRCISMKELNSFIIIHHNN